MSKAHDSIQLVLIWPQCSYVELVYTFSSHFVSGSSPLLLRIPLKSTQNVSIATAGRHSHKLHWGQYRPAAALESTQPTPQPAPFTTAWQLQVHHIAMAAAPLNGPCSRSALQSAQKRCITPSRPPFAQQTSMHTSRRQQCNANMFPLRPHHVTHNSHGTASCPCLSPCQTQPACTVAAAVHSTAVAIETSKKCRTQSNLTMTTKTATCLRIAARRTPQQQSQKPRRCSQEQCRRLVVVSHGECLNCISTSPVAVKLLPALPTCSASRGHN